MLNIGDFARFAGVSVRMLRHYDALGLLVPTTVDPRSGYRRYDESLLTRAHHLVALKELGFTLEQVGDLLDATSDRDEMRTLLDARRAELHARIAADRSRLDEVERRLRLMEGDTMELEFRRTSLPPLEVTQLTAEVADQAEIGPTIGPLFGRLGAAAGRQGVATGPMIGWYDLAGDRLRIGAAVGARVEGDGLEHGRLDGAERAVVATYVGPMTHIGEAWQAVGAYLSEQGLEATGICREVYVDTPMDRPNDWVTELQQPVA